MAVAESALQSIHFSFKNSLTQKKPFMIFPGNNKNTTLTQQIRTIPLFFRVNSTQRQYFKSPPDTTEIICDDIYTKPPSYFAHRIFRVFLRFRVGHIMHTHTRLQLTRARGVAG